MQSIQNAGYFKAPWQKTHYFDRRILKIERTQRLESRAASVLSDLIEGIIRDLVTKNDLNELSVSSIGKTKLEVKEGTFHNLIKESIKFMKSLKRDQKEKGKN